MVFPRRLCSACLEAHAAPSWVSLTSSVRSVYDAKVIGTEPHEAIAKSLPLSIDRPWMMSRGRVCERLMIRTSSSSRRSAGETAGDPVAL
jgi:hypothetical protein